MKHDLLTTVRLFLLLPLLAAAFSCQHIYDEESGELSPSTLPLKVSTRSAGESRINYPAYIYAFLAKDGSYVASQKMADSSSPIELKLAPDKYTIVAIAGIGEEYVLPEKPQLTDVITMKKDNRSGRAMMLGRSSVTVAAGSGKGTSVSVTLSYAVSLVNVSLKDIPSTVRKVSLRLSPLYSSVAFNGEYTGKDQSTEIGCTRESNGTWSAAPFYVFPGSGTQTAFTIVAEDDEQVRTYGYTFKGKPEANVPFNISGSYSGAVTLGGALLPTDWEKPVEATFSFGRPNTGDEGNSPAPPTVTPDLSELPEKGTIWNDGIVVGPGDTDAEGTEVLLMSLQEWTSLPSSALQVIEEAVSDGWHLPTEAEARTLNATFNGTSLEELNETIDEYGNGDPLINVDKRYLYDHNGSLYAFGFKASSQFKLAGSKTKYNIRLLKNVPVNTEK